MNILKINPQFGETLYNALSPALFYIAFFCVIIGLVTTLMSKKNIAFILAQLLISAVVLFAIYNPHALVSVGEFTFGFLFSLLKEIEVEEAFICKIMI